MTGEGGLSADTSLPLLLKKNWQQWGANRIAARRKQFGIWEEYTWEHHYQETKTICLGLISLGFNPFDRAMILGKGCPEWLWCELAVQTLRGGALGPNPDEAPAGTENAVNSFQPRFAFVEHQGQANGLVTIRQKSPFLEKIVYWKGEGQGSSGDPILISLADLRKRGQEHEKAHPAEFDGKLNEVKSTDTAIVFATAQGGGSLRFTAATHQSLLSSLLANRASGAKYRGCRSEYVVMGSFGQPSEQVFGLAGSLAVGQTISFAEYPATAQGDFREICPHVVVLPAEAWNEIASTIESNARRGSWLKRQILSRSLSVRLKLVDKEAEHKSPGVWERLAGGIAGLVTVQPIKDKHGLNRATITFASGNGVFPESVRLLKAVDVHLEQVQRSGRDGIVGTDPGNDLRVG